MDKVLTLHYPNGNTKKVPLFNDNKINKLFGPDHHRFDFEQCTLFVSDNHIDNFKLGYNHIGDEFHLKLYGVVGSLENPNK